VTVRESMPGQTPKLSVVVGSNNARASIAECLSALVEQSPAGEVEIIVVDSSSDGSADVVRERFPEVTLVEAPHLHFIPELWGVGVAMSKGELVAITTAHCGPAPDWVEEVTRAHAGDYAGIGGAIENDPSAGLVDWAVYLCRYTPYMLPFEPVEAADVAGDNASYKREALAQCEGSMAGGFWEPVVHAALQRRGMRLLLTPRVVVRHRHSFGLRAFAVQRFWHGRQFGSSRAHAFPTPRRAVYAALGPAIPLIFLWRIGRRVVTRRRHAGRLAAALPVLVLFLVSWSAGEISGYLLPARKGAPPGRAA
jgi:glycosyltransferase involved in cell wall biosynthesis